MTCSKPFNNSLSFTKLGPQRFEELLRYYPCLNALNSSFSFTKHDSKCIFDFFSDHVKSEKDIVFIKCVSTLLNESICGASIPLKRDTNETVQQIAKYTKYLWAIVQIMHLMIPCL